MPSDAFDDSLVAGLIMSGSAVSVEKYWSMSPQTDRLSAMDSAICGAPGNVAVPVEKYGMDFAIQCLVKEMQRQEMHLGHERDRIAQLRAELAETEQLAWMAQNKIAACKAALVALGHVASD